MSSMPKAGRDRTSLAVATSHTLSVGVGSRVSPMGGFTRVRVVKSRPSGENAVAKVCPASEGRVWRTTPVFQSTTWPGSVPFSLVIANDWRSGENTLRAEIGPMPRCNVCLRLAASQAVISWESSGPPARFLS